MPITISKPWFSFHHPCRASAPHSEHSSVFSRGKLGVIAKNLLGLAHVTGEGAPPVVQRVLDLRDSDGEVRAHGFEGAIRIAANRYRQDSTAVSEAKLLSLISYSMRRERRGDHMPRSAEERRAHVESMIITGRKNFFRGTTLLKSDLEEMQRLFHDTRHYQPDFFEGSVQAVEARVRARLSVHPLTRDMAAEPRTHDRIMKKSANEIFRSGSAASRALLDRAPAQETREITDEEWRRLKELSPEIAESGTRQYGKVMSRQVKDAAKSLRSHGAQDMGRMGRAMGAMQTGPLHPDLAVLPARPSWASPQPPKIFVRRPSESSSDQ